MSIIFERISAPIGSVTFTSADYSYPHKRPFEFRQPVDWSDGGQIYSYNKGIVTDKIILDFVKMTASEYNNLVTFIKNIAQGKSYNFKFTDNDSNYYTVRLLNNTVDFQLESSGTYSGILELLKEA